MTGNDERYMMRTLRLARRSRDAPSSEPRTGALVVSRDQVVGAGAAISAALDKAGRGAEGATLYTNIEPGLDAADLRASIKHITDSRIARVVIGATAHSTEAGAVDLLRQARVEVVTGVCEHQARELNESYLKYSSTGLPFITVKFASTLDGRLAAKDG